MSTETQLVLRHDPSKVAKLQKSTPTTIGRAEGNRLRLVSLGGVADHHAVVRFSRSQGWLVCDWQSSDGTYLEGQRIRQCRRLSDGDEIQLGTQGPVLVFQLGTAGQSSTAPDSPQTRPGKALPAGPTTPPPGPEPGRTAPGAQGSPRPAPAAGASAAPLTLGGKTIPLEQIRSAHLHSRPRHPYSFSWWVLACLGGMVLLPWPWLFWGVEISALAAWIMLGSRKEHELVLTLRDGMAHRHSFANRSTALSHRNGIRKAIGQSLESG